MHELFHIHARLDAWLQNGRQIAIATVTKTWGSAPRRPGALMAITNSYEMLGSVSAGCVEGAVVEAAQEVIQRQHPQALHYGISDELALDVGLACGGEISIFVEPYTADLHQCIAAQIESEQAFIWQTHFGEEQLSQAIITDDRQDAPVTLTENCISRQIVPPRKLVIVGGNHIAVSLAQMAQLAGYQIVIIDPRTAFANRERFPHANRILNAYPHAAFERERITPSTAIAILAHDPKIDDPALEIALQSEAFYVGALGGRKTQRKRRERLSENGFSLQQIERLHGPIGLDINAESPAEIAISILAEIVSQQSVRITSLDRLQKS